MRCRRYRGGATNAVAADVNGDGKIDLVCSTDPGGIAIYLGNGNGTFTLGQTISIPLYPAESLIVADLNGDGILDIAQAKNTSLGVFQGNGDGTFQTGPNPWFGLGPSPGAMVIAGLHS